MINTSTYRGFEVIVNVGSGGWIVQRHTHEGHLDDKIIPCCSQPTEDAARQWIDTQILAASALERPR